MGIRDWRPPAFASHYRRQAPGLPPIERWEHVLRVERTITFQLLTALARRPRLRRWLGIPERLGSLNVSSLNDRQARLGAMRATKLGARLGERRSGGDLQPTQEHSGVDLPRVGPLLDREIESALELLATMSFEELQRRGWHFQPNHFYWPLNDVAFLRENPQLWTDPKLPDGVDWDLDGQAELIRRLARYSIELAGVREGPRTRPGDFVWGQSFGGLDAYAYYGLVRDLQPSRVVEVGIGTSSTLLMRALAANERSCEVTLIDPNPKQAVLGETPQNWRVVTSLVQRVDPDVFAPLQAGDILFYDGSHCVRTGSDVNWIFFEVLPRLPAGVWIHVHDILWPGDYSPDWILDEGLTWNEQYLVQAFLMHNDSYRVRLGSVMLHHHRGRILDDLLPPGIWGASSLWLEKVA